MHERWSYLDTRYCLVGRIGADARTQPEEVFHHPLLLCSFGDITDCFSTTRTKRPTAFKLPEGYQSMF